MTEITNKRLAELIAGQSRHGKSFHDEAVLVALIDFARLRAQLAAGVIVPREPTQAMLTVGNLQINYWTGAPNSNLAKVTYKAMLSAAPAQPEPVEQRKGEELLRTVNTQAMYQIGIDLRQNRRQSQGTSADRKNRGARRGNPAQPDTVAVSVAGKNPAAPHHDSQPAATEKTSKLRLEWTSPLTSKSAAKFHLTKGFVAAELHESVIRELSAALRERDEAIESAKGCAPHCERGDYLRSRLAAMISERDSARALLTEAVPLLHHTRCMDDDALACPACSVEARIEALT